MFNGTGACMSWYEASESGVAGQTSGANQACYDYHLAVAAGSAANPALQRAHCQHAAGAADGNGVAPCVGNISTNGTAASNFCDQFNTTCTSLPSIENCIGWYSGQPVGVAGQKSGGTQSCYDYHLAVAVGTGDSASVHCFHATGRIDPCSGDEPAVVVDDAYNFCFSYMETCAGATQFSDMGSCITWYSSSDVGIQGQKDGSTQSCYAYHLAVASGISLASSAPSSDDDGGSSGATAAAVIIVLLLLVAAVVGYIYRDTIAVKIGLRSAHRKHGHQAHVSNPATAAAYELETTASTEEEKPAMPSRPPMPQRPTAKSGSRPDIPARPEQPTVVDFSEPPVPVERQNATPRRAPPRRAAPRLERDESSEI